VRNAFILLVVVALVILGVGAFNNGVAFNVDYVAGTANAVSLLWVSGLLAVLVLVVGMAAAWFAQSAMKGSRRKLEAELQSTYERLREAEALAARRATEVVAATAAAEPETAAVVADEDVTVVATEDATIVSDAAASDEAVTTVAGEAATEVAAGEAETVAGADVAPEGGAAAETPESEIGEQTAVTMAGEVDPAAAAPAGAESPAAEPPSDDTGAAGPASS